MPRTKTALQHQRRQQRLEETRRKEEARLQEEARLRKEEEEAKKRMTLPPWEQSLKEVMLEHNPHVWVRTEHMDYDYGLDRIIPIHMVFWTRMELVSGESVEGLEWEKKEDGSYAGRECLWIPQMRFEDPEDRRYLLRMPRAHFHVIPIVSIFGVWPYRFSGDFVYVRYNDYLGKSVLPEIYGQHLVDLKMVEKGQYHGGNYLFEELSETFRVAKKESAKITDSSGEVKWCKHGAECEITEISHFAARCHPPRV